MEIKKAQMVRWLKGYSEDMFISLLARETAKAILSEMKRLRARVAELEDDFAKRQASHCCPTWNDQMEDCDCDERMGGHIARWQEAEAEVARLREVLAQVRDAMLATGQGPDGDDDPRRPVATAVWRALASAPSAEATL